MKPWSKEELDFFKLRLCDMKYFQKCTACDRSNEFIIQCFNDLTNPFSGEYSLQLQEPQKPQSPTKE